MVRNQAWPCTACAYWQPYPSLEGVGACDNTLSRSYSRMAMGIGAPCEYFVPATDASPGGSRETRESVGPSHMTCVSCHYWFPFETMPRVGECDNPSSGHFRKPTFSDKLTEECFVIRYLDDLEFMWCQTHRQTIHATDLQDHRRCSLFVSSVSLPVEEQVGLTLAGD